MASKTINLWVVAYIITVMKALSFDVDTLLDQAIGVAMGQSDPRVLLAQFMKELGDVIRSIGDDTVGTIMEVSTNMMSLAITRKILQFILKLFKAPRSIPIPGTDYILRWA